jgi:NTE family protein
MNQQPLDAQVAPMNAVVLGGGGPAGAAWTSALLHGLVTAGIPLSESDVVVGTSAGAVVGAWLTIQPDGLPSVVGLMRDRAAWHAANAGSGRGDMSLLRRMAEGSGRGPDAALSIAQAAIAAIPPITADQAEGLWKAALPEGTWPRRLRIVAVNAGTGAARAWSAQDEIPLSVAVAGSTAAPGAAPPVTVADSVWVDGGVRSGTNADLLVDPADGNGSARAGYHTGPGRVLIVAPMPSDDLAREEAVLVAAGHRVRVITPGPAGRGLNPFDPRSIDLAADAGSGQAREISADLAEWWGE